MLGNMRPVLPRNDGAYRGLSDAISLRDGGLGLAALVPLANGRHIEVREFGQIVHAPLGLGVSRASVLADHVRHVVSLSANEQVIRSHAVTNVAAVQNKQAIRYFAEGQLPSKAMRMPRSAILVAKCAVARVIPCTLPEPTRVAIGSLNHEFKSGASISSLTFAAALTGAELVCRSLRVVTRELLSADRAIEKGARHGFIVDAICA